MRKTFIFTSTILFLIYLTKVTSQQNPCPDVFEFFDDANTGHGIITIPSPGYGTTSMTAKIAIRGNIRKGNGEGLGLRKSLDATVEDVRRGRDIQYKLTFPLSNGFPYILSIIVNGDIEICSGRAGSNLATWSFSHRFSYPSDNLNPSNPYGNRQPAVTVRPTPAPTRAPTATPATPRVKPVTPRPKPRPPSPPVRTSENDASWLTQYRYAQECGNRNEAKLGITHTVIGGVPVRKAEYPWLVALYKAENKNGQTTRKYICGANLVSNQHVITAAHCIGTEKRLYMELGRYDLSDLFEEDYEVRVSQSITMHTEYRPNTGHADIAIITFKQVSFSDQIRPICLWSFGSNSNSLGGTIVGWGREEQGGPIAPKPLQLTVDMVSQSECDADEKLRSISSSKTFCAGGKNKGPCHGDSGGGLYIVRDNRWYLRGIISTSIGNDFVCDVSKYAVYADVAQYLDWLQSYLI